MVDSESFIEIFYHFSSFQLNFHLFTWFTIRIITIRSNLLSLLLLAIRHYSRAGLRKQLD